MILKKLFCNFGEVALQHEWSSIYLLHIAGAPFYKNTYGGLILKRTPKTTNVIPYNNFKTTEVSTLTMEDNLLII